MPAFTAMKMMMAVLPVVLAFTSCSKPAARLEQPAAEVAVTTPEPMPERGLPAMEIPHSPPSVSAARPAPMAPEEQRKELAPEGVFYLIKPARIETPDGIVGLSPGTGVKLVRPGVYLTPNGEASLPDDSLTNDMIFARQVLKADRDTQTASRVASAAQASAIVTAPTVQAQSTASSDAKAEADAKKGRIAELRATKKALQVQLNAAMEKHTAEQMRATDKGHIIASSSQQNIKVLSEKIAAIEIEIAALSRR